MRKIFKVISLLFVVLSIFGCEVNVDDSDSKKVEQKKEDKIVSIQIVKGLKTITYEQGSEFLLDGLEVEAVYESGKKSKIANYTTKPENHSILNTLGINQVYIYFEGLETSTFVTVVEKESPAIVAPSYFWGNWQRMDSGEVYSIDETTVYKNAGSTNKKYLITAVTDDSIETDIGVFQKQSDQVLLKDNIPYFRQGGSNLSYSLKIVGFTDEIQSRATSTSGIALKGLKGTGKSSKFTSFNSESKSDDNGVLHLTAPTAADVQTVTIESDNDLIVVPNIVVLNDGDFMGTVPIVGKNDYSLKITGKIADSEKSDGYLYGNFYKEYPLTLTITNISKIDSSPLLCTIEPENESLSVSSNLDISGIPISSLKSGLTKTIALKVQFGSIYESYIDTGLKIFIKDSKTGREWSDYIPLRFYKGLMPVTIAARSTEDNPEAALNGFIIYPDGNSQFFSVADKDKKVVYVPTFGKSKNYLLAFSGANVSGELTNSTEMFYTVSICSSTAKKVIISGNDAFKAMQFGENNENEDSAYTIKDEFEAYIADGDIDFFKFEAESPVVLLPGEHICEITYESEYGVVPENKKVVTGSVFSEEELPELSKSDLYFAGWYNGETKVNIGDVISTETIHLVAKWNRYYTVTFKTDKGNAPEKMQIPGNVIFDAENLPVIENYGSYKHLGWCLLSSDEVIKKLIIHDDIILYAKWDLFASVNITIFSRVNGQCGCFVKWDLLSDADSYNLYEISSSGKKDKILSTEESYAFFDVIPDNIAISAVVNGEETHLSKSTIGENIWWTSVKCDKVDDGYSLQWKAIPIAEDYVLISKYEVENLMQTYIRDMLEYKTSDLYEYEKEPVYPSNPYNSGYIYRRCVDLKTTENNIIFDSKHFKDGYYLTHIALYAKIGEVYYQLSDNISFK